MPLKGRVVGSKIFNTQPFLGTPYNICFMKARPGEVYWPQEVSPGTDFSPSNIHKNHS